MTIQSVYSAQLAIAFTVNGTPAGTANGQTSPTSSPVSSSSNDDTATISSAAQALSDASQDPSSRVDDVFKKLDTNGDGSISKDEFKENASKVADDLKGVHRGHHGHHRRRLEKLFSRIDGNGDGKIDKDELAGALKKGGHQSQSLDADAIFKKLDANGDGSISKDELKAEPPTSSSIYVVSITAIVQYQAAAKAPAASQVGTHISAAA